MRPARKYPPLTEGQRDLVERNVALAWFVARKMWHKMAEVRALGIDNARQSATLGLIKAAICYDPERQVAKFSTYAAKAARREVKREVARQSYPVNIPDYWISGCLQSGRPRRHAREAGAVRGMGVLSLDDARPGTLWSRESREAVEEEGAGRHEPPRVVGLLRKLSDRERRVILMRFWFGLTLKECGKSLRLTREGVRQVEARALASLRWMLECAA